MQEKKNMTGRSTAKWLLIPFIVQAGQLLAQSSVDSAKAGFKLALSAHYDHSTFEKNIIALVVTMTNTSRRTIRFEPCTSFGGPYRVHVIYNGVPIEEPEQSRKETEEIDRREAAGGTCKGRELKKQIKPGGSEEDNLLMDGGERGYL